MKDKIKKLDKEKMSYMCKYISDFLLSPEDFDNKNLLKLRGDEKKELEELKDYLR